jgi:hypothetical protein
VSAAQISGFRPSLLSRFASLPDFLLDQIAQARAVALPGLHRGEDTIGGGDADVRGNQELLERLDRLDVNRPRSLLGRIGAADDVIEPIDNLLGGAGEAFAEAVEKCHLSGSYIAAEIRTGERLRLARR